MHTLRSRVLLGVLLILLAARASPAASRYDPRLRFQAFRTPHFDIYWHQGEEAAARRLAAIAERVRARLASELGSVHGRVQVVLVDQSDITNGWATPVPYNTIELTLRPPPADAPIGNTTDWLELVFTHEYTHIVHLDRTGGVLRPVRRIFGRVPIAFPNLFLPAWQVEGLATFEESHQGGEGRVASASFGAIVDAAVRQGRFEPFDRAAGGLDVWPAGEAPYAYGSAFHRYLADRFGPERLASLADATAGRLPLFGAGAFRAVFGAPLPALWRDFERARQRNAAPAGRTDAAAVRLTHIGYSVGALAGAGPLFFSVATADRYPALMRRDEDGRVSRIAWRYLGERTAVHGSWVVFDQIAPVRNVAWQSDLYAVPATGGAVHRLTREARAAAPAFSPDGTRLACVIETGGVRSLAVLPFNPSGLAHPAALTAAADGDFGAPDWSPDGREIVAERRVPGAFELVVVDAATGAWRAVLRSAGRLATPTWRPDGRGVLFTAELEHEASNAFLLDLASGEIRRVTDAVNGVRLPHLSADGRVLTYIGYTADGDDLFSVATEPAGWPRVDAGRFRPRAVEPAEASETSVAAEAYSPWRTLRPTYWSPVAYSDAGELVLGAGTAMSDVLGRHAYAVEAGWSSRARPDWSVAYAYDRWRPTIFAGYSDDTDPVRGGAVRSQEFTAGARLPFRALRRVDEIFGAIDFVRDRLTCGPGCRARAAEGRRTALQAGWRHDTRRQFGLSIGAEEGWLASAAVESAVRALGAGVRAQAVVAEFRGFRRLGPGHVVAALRGATALGFGAIDERRIFSAAGAGPAIGGFDFGRDAIGLLRGVAAEDVVGTRAAVINAELRMPLARPQRGFGSWPLFVRAVHAAVFLDAGAAWDTRLRRDDVAAAIGGEGSIDLVLGHALPLRLSAGGAWRRAPAGSSAGGAALFARVGHAF
jgi:hypothetical protein